MSWFLYRHFLLMAGTNGWRSRDRHRHPEESLCASLDVRESQRQVELRDSGWQSTTALVAIMGASWTALYKFFVILIRFKRREILIERRKTSPTFAKAIFPLRYVGSHPRERKTNFRTLELRRSLTNETHLHHVYKNYINCLSNTRRCLSSLIREYKNNLKNSCDLCRRQTMLFAFDEYTGATSVRPIWCINEKRHYRSQIDQSWVNHVECNCRWSTLGWRERVVRPVTSSWRLPRTRTSTWSLWAPEVLENFERRSLEASATTFSRNPKSLFSYSKASDHRMTVI